MGKRDILLLIIGMHCKTLVDATGTDSSTSTENTTGAIQTTNNITKSTQNTTFVDNTTSDELSTLPYQNMTPTNLPIVTQTQFTEELSNYQTSTQIDTSSNDSLHVYGPINNAVISSSQVYNSEMSTVEPSVLPDIALTSTQIDTTSDDSLHVSRTMNNAITSTSHIYSGEMSTVKPSLLPDIASTNDHMVSTVAECLSSLMEMGPSTKESVVSDDSRLTTTNSMQKITPQETSTVSTTETSTETDDRSTSGHDETTIGDRYPTLSSLLETSQSSYKESFVSTNSHLRTTNSMQEITSQETSTVSASETSTEPDNRSTLGHNETTISDRSPTLSSVSETTQSSNKESFVSTNSHLRTTNSMQEITSQETSTMFASETSTEPDNRSTLGHNEITTGDRSPNFSSVLETTQSSNMESLVSTNSLLRTTNSMQEITSQETLKMSASETSTEPDNRSTLGRNEITTGDRYPTLSSVLETTQSSNKESLVSTNLLLRTTNSMQETTLQETSKMSALETSTEPDNRSTLGHNETITSDRFPTLSSVLKTSQSTNKESFMSTNSNLNTTNSMQEITSQEISTASTSETSTKPDDQSTSGHDYSSSILSTTEIIDSSTEAGSTLELNTRSSSFTHVSNLVLTTSSHHETGETEITTVIGFTRPMEPGSINGTTHKSSESKPMDQTTETVSSTTTKGPNIADKTFGVEVIAGAGAGVAVLIVLIIIVVVVKTRSHKPDREDFPVKNGYNSNGENPLINGYHDITINRKNNIPYNIYNNDSLRNSGDMSMYIPRHK